MVTRGFCFLMFKGRKIDWKLVRDYLKRFVGDCYEVEQSSEKIYIGGKLPDEYTGSESRIALKKAEAKAKSMSHREFLN